MKFCTGGYVKRGTYETVLSHVQIVFDEQSTPLSQCPLCAEKAWHESTAIDLRQAEDEIGKYKRRLVEICRDDLID